MVAVPVAPVQISNTTKIFRLSGVEFADLRPLRVAGSSGYAAIVMAGLQNTSLAVAPNTDTNPGATWVTSAVVGGTKYTLSTLTFGPATPDSQFQLNLQASSSYSVPFPAAFLAVVLVVCFAGADRVQCSKGQSVSTPNSGDPTYALVGGPSATHGPWSHLIGGCAFETNTGPFPDPTNPRSPLAHGNVVYNSDPLIGVDDTIFGGPAGIRLAGIGVDLGYGSNVGGLQEYFDTRSPGFVNFGPVEPSGLTQVIELFQDPPGTLPPPPMSGRPGGVNVTGGIAA